MDHILDSVISNSPVAPSSGDEAKGASRDQGIELGNQSRAAHVGITRRGRGSELEINQEFSQGAGSSARDIRLRTELHLDEPDYYFELLPLELIESPKTGVSYERLSPGTPLRVGRTYRVQVGLTKNQYKSPFQVGVPQYNLRQRGVKVSGDVFIQLTIASQDPNVIEAVGDITPGQHFLSGIDAKVQEFEFTIQKDHQLEIPLELSFTDESSGLPKQAAMLCLNLEGKKPPSPAFSEVFQLSAKVAPPPDAVVLYVSEGNEGSLMLRGWLGGRSDGTLTLEVGAFGWVDPQDCANVETYLQKLRDSFYDYNIDCAAGVAAWFEKALQRSNKLCTIFIVDEAGALIPWEMFKLPDGRYLGAQALIVRCAEAQYSAGQKSAFVSDAKYEGRLSAYVHPLDSAMMGELPEMDRLLPSYTQTPLGLQRDLRSGGDQVGLVYLCYGGVLDYGDEEDCMTQLSRFKPYQEDVRIRFDLLGGKLKPRPIFFVNAPYSGRMHKSGQQWCGLARATLKQVAASYIGTLGPVEPSYAARFALKLLKEAASDKGVKPAELLREMRVQAIEQLNNEELNEEDYERAYKELAYPFMYVHYGHPQDWLKITRAPEPEDAEGSDEHV